MICYMLDHIILSRYHDPQSPGGVKRWDPVGRRDRHCPSSLAAHHQSQVLTEWSKCWSTDQTSSSWSGSTKTARCGILGPRTCQSKSSRSSWSWRESLRQQGTQLRPGLPIFQMRSSGARGLSSLPKQQSCLIPKVQEHHELCWKPGSLRCELCFFGWGVNTQFKPKSINVNCRLRRRVTRLLGSPPLKSKREEGKRPNFKKKHQIDQSFKLKKNSK